MDILTLYELYKDSGRLISTDSRQVPKGGLFFALKGDNFDGNQFAAAALEAGAAYAVVDDPKLQAAPGCIWVPDVLTALQELAHYHRRHFTFPILAITGSNGKTTTKELVYRVLASHYTCGVTRGNLNNHIGVPLTLLTLDEEMDIAVVEMGANHQGEIALLCAIAAPTHGVITNVGKAHLEGFGGLEGVIKGKGELYDFLTPSGVVFVNSDEDFLRGMSDHLQRKVFYGSCPSRPQSLYQVQLIQEQPFLEVAFADEHGALWQATSHLVGKHNLANLTTAISIGQYFKVPEYKIAAAIEAYVPSNNRSQILDIADNRFLLDAYNANPSSMRKALESFSQLSCGKSSKVAILGDMLELGTYTDTEHQAIVDIALNLGFDQLILVGKAFAKAANAHGVLHFDNTPQLKKWLEAHPFKDSCILLKASRGIGLERLLQLP